jgi:4-hydroxybenzoate polyprenyltransferase
MKLIAMLRIKRRVHIDKLKTTVSPSQTCSRALPQSDASAMESWRYSLVCFLPISGLPFLFSPFLTSLVIATAPAFLASLLILDYVFPFDSFPVILLGYFFLFDGSVFLFFFCVCILHADNLSTCCPSIHRPRPSL